MPDARNAVEVSWINVGTMSDGGPLRLVVHRITGKPGPTVAVLGTVHGEEPITAEMVRRVIEELRSADLSGTVLAMPVINPIGFESNTRNTWVDMANLNRCFPGNPRGSVTEQIGAAITQEVLNQAEALIDLHSGSWQFITDYSYTYPGAEEYCNAFGSLSTVRQAPIKGSSAGLFAEKGKLAVISECGGGNFREEYYIQKGVTGTLNCLKFLKLIPGEPVLEAKPVLSDKRTLFRPRHGGLLIPELKGPDMGRIVPKGTLLARMISPYTFEILEEFRAPYERTLITLVCAGISRMHPGDFAYAVADPD